MITLPIAAAALALASTSYAQTDLLPTSVSPQCMLSFVPLTYSSLNSCLRVPDAFHFYKIGNNSMISHLESYLSKFCDPSQTPVCEEAVLHSSAETMRKSCDVGWDKLGNFEATAHLLLTEYPLVREAMCSKDPVTDRFCVPSTFEIIENDLPNGQNASIPWLRGVIAAYTGESDDWSTAEQFWKLVRNKELCTPCFGGLLNNAMSVELLHRDWPLMELMRNNCGPAFGDEPAVGVYIDSSKEVVNETDTESNKTWPGVTGMPEGGQLGATLSFGQFAGVLALSAVACLL